MAKAKKHAKKSKKQTTKTAKKKAAKKPAKKAAARKASPKPKAPPVVVISGAPPWVNAFVTQMFQRMSEMEITLNAINSVLGNRIAGQPHKSAKRIEQEAAGEVETRPTNGESQMGLFDNVPDDPTGKTPVSKEEITQVLQEVSAKFGMDKVKEILKTYKAKKISDVPESDYAAFYSDCKAANETQATT